MAPDEESLREGFCDAGQGHIFGFWDELSSDERSVLLAQLRAVDLDHMKILIETHLAERAGDHQTSVEPPTVIPHPEGHDDADTAESKRVGEEALRGGHVAALVVAGGQATRLGYEQPKGTFPIAPVTGKSLFQLHAEKILAHQRRHGSRIPFLVLVSPHNRVPTMHYFEQNEYFGLTPEDVHFFEQGMLPAVDRDGRLLLAEKGRIFLSPDGHGGVFRALLRADLFEVLADRGVHTVFYFQVDNPLVRVCDPVFLGHHLRGEAELSLKVVHKRSPEEKVGIYAQIDGRPGVLEYSDVPEAILEATDDEGELLYRAGNIGIHVFNLQFMKTVGTGERRLPYHMARKRVPFVDESGELKQPGELNGLKFESFVFDALPLTERVVAMEVRRREEFAPVKNRTGEDSPETSIRAQSDLFRSWLGDAGIPVLDADALIEIGPLFALDRDELIQMIQEQGLRGARKVLLD